MIKNADKHECAGFTSATKTVVCGGIPPQLSASFISKITKNGIGPLAIMHLEDKLSDMERAWSARSKPHDFMQENSVNFHTPPLQVRPYARDCLATEHRHSAQTIQFTNSVRGIRSHSRP